MEKDAVENIEKKQHYLLFYLAGELFTINVKYILRVLEALSFTKVPQGPSFLKGVVNFNGNVLPVVDTYIKFGLPAKKDFKKSLILVLSLNIEEKNTTLGILVDGSDDVFEVKDSDIRPYPATGSKYNVDYIDGVIEQKGKFILILNPEKLFENEALLQLGNEKPALDSDSKDNEN